jgi:hypothetical protein
MTELNLRRVVARALDNIIWEREGAGDRIGALFDAVVERLLQHPRLSGISRFELELFLFDLRREAEDALDAFAEIHPDRDARDIVECIDEEFKEIEAEA